jgi:hypothetical protein
MAAAIAVLWSAWGARLAGSPSALRIEELLLAAALVGGFILPGLFPIHLRYHTKLEITTPQLFLMAFLLPPELAALAAGGATLTCGMLMARQRGNTRSDIATAVARWVLVVWLGSSVANVPALKAGGLATALVATAAVMLAGDVLSAAFEISPMSGEPPLHVMASLLREAVPFEVLQYLLGFLGAIVALSQTWALALMALPLVAVYLVLKGAKEMQNSTQQILISMADMVDLRSVCRWALAPRGQLVRAAAK